VEKLLRAVHYAMGPLTLLAAIALMVWGARGSRRGFRH